jgi:hypothetical protein
LDLARKSADGNGTDKEFEKSVRTPNQSTCRSPLSTEDPLAGTDIFRRFCERWERSGKKFGGEPVSR